MDEYSQIVTKIRNTPWLILPESLATILEIVDRRLDGERLSTEEIRVKLAASPGSSRSLSRAEAGGGVGVLPLYGPIFPKANMMTEMSGATSIESFRSDFRALMANDLVSSIVLDIDSPGGTSDLVPEMGAEIRAARDIKPIYAVANTTAGSAAYWLMSQATAGYVTPSGSVGSIGVYSVHEDNSRKQEMAGTKTTFISAGRFKVEGNPYQPLTAEALAHRQTVVDELYNQFIDAVAEGRGVSSEIVRSTYGEGRMFSAQNAYDAGMVDGVMTLDNVLGDLLRGGELPALVPNAIAARATHFRTAMEVAEWEHSEPGSGSPPIPRTDEDDRSGDYRGSGSRRDTPPIATEEEQMNDFLSTFARGLGITATETPDVIKQLNAKLGTKIAEDASDDVVISALARHQYELSEEIAPLREARLASERQRSFREMFPEEAERLENLTASERLGKAEAFGNSFARLTTLEGGVSKYGYSPLVRERLQAFHAEYAGRVNMTELTEILNAIGNGGIVEYGERASSLPKDDELGDDPKGLDFQLARKLFAEKVNEIVAEDKLEYSAAVKEAAKRYPNLAEAYHGAHARP